MTAQKTSYEQMFPHEFKSAIERTSVAFLPLGSLEYHGYHNVLGLDSLKVWKICQLVAKKVGGVVFPPLYLGLDGYPDLDLKKYPNKQFDCYHLDRNLYKQVLENYFKRMARIGFKTIFVLAGHYPNAEVTQEAAAAFNTNEVKIIVAKEPDFIIGAEGDHAGKWETSIMMYLFPELVDLKLMSSKHDRLRAVVGEDPFESSVDFGKEVVDKIVSGIAASLS